jgi:hypothetical protein
VQYIYRERETHNLSDLINILNLAGAEFALKKLANHKLHDKAGLLYLIWPYYVSDVCSTLSSGILVIDT